MANTIMTTVYNHYMTTYSPKKSDARLDSHKKSELKNIYSKENSSLGELSGYGYVYITGMDFDSRNNLWIANQI